MLPAGKDWVAGIDCSRIAEDTAGIAAAEAARMDSDSLTLEAEGQSFEEQWARSEQLELAAGMLELAEVGELAGFAAEAALAAQLELAQLVLVLRS